MIFDDALERIEAASTPPSADPKCGACGFCRHSHLQYSEICPVLVRGMLSMFRVEEASDAAR